MKIKGTARLAALLLAVAMLICALAACGDRNKPAVTPAPTDEPSAAPTDVPSEAPADHEHDHDHDFDEDPANIPIGRVGSIEFTMADYLSLYQMYASYAEYIPDFTVMVKDALIESGVLMTRCEEMGLELDDAEELELQKQLDEELDYALSQMTIEDGVNGEEAVRAAQIEAFEALIAQYGYTLDSYMSELEDSIRQSMLMNKLRELVKGEVEFGDEQVEEYFNDALASDTERYKDAPSEFAAAYNAYISARSRIPFYTPEGMFTVKHLLIQYENTFNVPEEEGVFGEDQNKKLNEVRASLKGGISLEEFIASFVSSADYNDDTALLPYDPSEDNGLGDHAAGYREHGYLMHEALVGSYFEGFGEAACVLKLGEDWRPANASEGSEPPEAPVEKFGMVFYETTDGHRIAEVRTNSAGGGIHFIFIAEELESGEAKLDMGNESDPVYAGIMEFALSELADEHFNAVLEEWKSNTAVELDDELIEHYLSEYLGGY